MGFPIPFVSNSCRKSATLIILAKTTCSVNSPTAYNYKVKIYRSKFKNWEILTYECFSRCFFSNGQRRPLLCPTFRYFLVEFVSLKTKQYIGTSILVNSVWIAKNYRIYLFEHWIIIGIHCHKLSYKKKFIMSLKGCLCTIRNIVFQ